MSTTNDPFTLYQLGQSFILAGAMQGLILIAVLLFQRQGNRRANVFFAVLVAVYTLRMWVDFLYYSNIIVQWPHWMGVEGPLMFLYGPFLLGYTRLLIHSRLSFKTPQLLHLIPTVVALFYFAPMYLKTGSEKLEIYQSFWTSEEPLQAFYLFWMLASGHGLFYTVLTFRLLKRHPHTLKQVFSSIETSNLRWLQLFTSLAGVLWVGEIGICVFFFLGTPVAGEWLLLSDILITVLLYGIGYRGLMQPEIFSTASDAPIRQPMPEKTSDISQKKESRLQLPNEAVEACLAQLNDLMDTQKLYTVPELKLQDVAEKLTIPAYQLSQIINDRLQKNFFDWVNAYRVEEAKKQLLNPEVQHLSIVGIAYEVGFGSKSAFYTAFKNQTQMTPSQYKKSQQSKT